MIFDGKLSPFNNSLVGCGNSHGQLNVWNTKHSLGNSCVTLNHGSEVLCLSWHNVNANLILSGCSDAVIRLWDLRSPGQPLKRFLGHDYGVKRLKFNPFDPGKFLSCSFDKTVRSWALENEYHHSRLEHHTEFVYGLDMSPFKRNLAIDCSWDSEIKLFDYF